MAAALGSGTYFDAVAQNVLSQRRAYLTLQGLDGALLLGYLLFLVTMLVGLLAGRHRWIQRAAEHPALVCRVQWWALAVGMSTGIVLAVASRFTEPFVPSLWFVVARTAYSVSRVALMIFYVATIVRLALNPRWLPRLTPLAAAGGDVRASDGRLRASAHRARDLLVQDLEHRGSLVETLLVVLAVNLYESRSSVASVTRASMLRASPEPRTGTVPEFGNSRAARAPSSRAQIAP
jgi:hypothetical protein